jgi:glycosyltransferase involved in cell wall biosynthesis
MAVSKQGKYKGQYIVCYFGSILPLQGIDVILEAFRLLQGKDKIKLICIGPVREKLKSDNIEYIDWLTQQKLADYIALSDLCLAGHFNKNIEKAKRTIPGKAFIYQAMEKPMIVGDNPANHELFTENEKVTFVEMGNPKALSSAIITRFEQYEEARRIS